MSFAMWVSVVGKVVSDACDVRMGRGITAGPGQYVSFFYLANVQQNHSHLSAVVVKPRATIFTMGMTALDREIWVKPRPSAMARTCTSPVR